MFLAGGTHVQDRASFTAETVALMRALETHRGAGRRLFVDPFAEPFTRGRLRLLARWSRLPGVGPAAAWVYDRVAGQGPRPSAVARTRFIDDEVSERAPTVEQLVLLGAGSTPGRTGSTQGRSHDLRGRSPGDPGAQGRDRRR
jgi:O-methyltransferase involved in polyketide biosynthesis